jgi:HK97 family phage portal protein
MMFHLVFMGNFYAYKNIVRGEIKELIPFAHYDVQVEQLKDFTLRYRLKGPDGTFREIDPSLIWHVRGPSWNSWMGLEGIKLAREAIGLSKSIENSQADFQKGGARVSGLLSLEDTIGSERFEFLSKWIDRHAAGGDREGKTLVMDRGGKFATMQMSGVDQQLIESRKFQVEEVCRHFRVMPIMVGFSDKASTYASAEQMFLAHVVHCLSPWYTRLEQSIDAHLLTDQDRKDGYYSNFVEEGLLRGAMKDTADFLVRLTSGGLMTRNEGRAKLDMNPLAGLDEPLTPANTTIGADPAPPEPPTPPPA